MKQLSWVVICFKKYRSSELWLIYVRIADGRCYYSTRTYPVKIDGIRDLESSNRTIKITKYIHIATQTWQEILHFKKFIDINMLSLKLITYIAFTNYFSIKG